MSRLVKKGKVYLVGAGPGDPGLLTTKGRQALEKADVIVYDRLITKQILRNLPKRITRIYVGKRPGSHSIPGQDVIPRILITNAQKGKTVVRLKGGDPFLLGRGGEEAQRLSEAEIDFEVIPGITSALAVPAYAGIPVTHREYASSVAIVTGHENPKKSKRVDWKKLATAVDTIVILMGIDNLQPILESLVEGGRNPDTPVAIVEKGTTKRQRVTIGSIRSMTAQVVERRVGPPAVIIVGNVVNLQKELSWFQL
jgi:uroporphyrinogen III methyltransferase/synthase